MVRSNIIIYFLVLTIILQKVEISINNAAFEHTIFKVTEDRKINYYKNNIFFNKKANLILKTYNAKELFLYKYNDTLNRITQDEIKKNKKVFVKKILVNRIFNFTFFIVYFLCYSYRYIITEEITIGTLWACYGACLSLFSNNLLRYFSTSQQAIQYLDRINTFFDLLDEKNDGLKLDFESDYRIEFEHVSFPYPEKSKKY